MRRLIIHPKDHTTDFLAALYEGWQDCEVYRGKLTSKEVNHAFHHCLPTTQIMLLGHGSDKGLYYRENSHKEGFDCVMVGHPHRHWLARRHNIVGIFCNADEFARAEGLHGLFTGMIISEMAEAKAYGICTTEEELHQENRKFAARLHMLLDSQIPLHEIPERMRAMDDRHSELTEFNYQRVFFV